MNWDVRHVRFVPDADMEGASIGSIKWGLGVALYRRDTLSRKTQPPRALSTGDGHGKDITVLDDHHIATFFVALDPSGIAITTRSVHPPRDVVTPSVSRALR